MAQLQVTNRSSRPIWAILRYLGLGVRGRVYIPSGASAQMVITLPWSYSIQVLDGTNPGNGPTDWDRWGRPLISLLTVGIGLLICAHLGVGHGGHHHVAGLSDFFQNPGGHDALDLAADATHAAAGLVHPAQPAMPIAEHTEARGSSTGYMGVTSARHHCVTERQHHKRLQLVIQEM